MSARFHAWREEPWPLLPWARMDSRYRRWVLATQAFCLLTLVPMLMFAGVPLEPTGWIYTGTVALITAVLSMAVFKSNEAQTFDFVNAIPMALIFAGRPGDALVCIVVANVFTPLRKPIVHHLALTNLIVAPWIFAACATFFHLAAGGMPVPSAAWAALAVVTYVLGYALELPLFSRTAVLGEYTTWSEAFDVWRDNLRAQLLSVVPLSIMAGALLVHPQVWYAVFLLPPFMITYQIFAQTDELVDVKTEAERDPLTGLNNRRSMLDRVERVAAAIGEGEGSSWIMLTDLDNFKHLNDTLGHDQGDIALVETARILRGAVRDRDYCARYGGEEFVVLVRDVDRDQIRTIAERIRSEIESELAERFGTTTSVGVYQLQQGDDPLAALNFADQAMYQSKRTGKNRATLMNPDGTTELLSAGKAQPTLGRGQDAPAPSDHAA